MYCTVELPIQTYRDRDRGIASTSDVDVFCRREDFLSSSSRVRKIFKTPKKAKNLNYKAMKFSCLYDKDEKSLNAMSALPLVRMFWWIDDVYVQILM